MSFDFSAMAASLGDDVAAKIGEPLGLDRDLSLRVVHSLSANWSKGREGALQATAAETGLGEDVVAAMLAKFTDAAKDQALDVAKDKLGEAADAAKEQAMAALEASPVGKAAGGFLGKLFGRKSA